jgi:acetyl-CoA carboxylase biotin carboxyl carrier protein
MTQSFDLDEIQRILELVRQHDLVEFELEHQGFKIRVRKEGSGNFTLSAPANHVAPAAAAPPPAPSAGPPPAQGPPAAADTEPGAAEEDSVELAVVKSPIVGTFYRSPEPGAKSFVEVGEIVKKGQVLCIIEAMKLMNEIESEYDGEVVNAYVENGQPVQYGERLFAIRT